MTRSVIQHGCAAQSRSWIVSLASSLAPRRIISVLIGAIGTCTVAETRAQDVLFTLDGVSFEHLMNVAPIGDLDGDGVSDLVVGASSTRRVSAHSGSTGSLLWEVTGTSGSGLGVWVAGAGDFDGDGVPDVIAGAVTDSTSGFHCGAAHVLSGVDGAVLASMYGEFPEEAFGYRVAGLGDINQDGYDDVAVAAAYHRLVRIYGGPDGRLLRTHAMGPQGTYFWRRPTMATLGDVDSDGVPDYVVGWPLDSTAGPDTGTVVLFSGRGGTPIHMVHGPTAAGSGLRGSFLGMSVACAGDIDGDGIPDFLAGAPGKYALTSGPTATQASVHLYSGGTAELLHAWDGTEQTGSQAGGAFGYHVAGNGDLNGDGVPDLLVGAPNDASRGTVSAYSGLSKERLWRVLATSIGTRMYYGALVGDLDGDGLGDFAVGDNRDPSGGSSAGRITLYAGAPGDVARHCTGDEFLLGRTIRLEASGPIGIGNNYLSLLATNAPPDGIAHFVYGPPTPQVPFGGSWRCTGPPAYALAPPLGVDASGHVQHTLDFTLPPLAEGPGQVLPGSTWSFQLYCRDPHPTSSGPRLSDGLLITFLP